MSLYYAKLSSPFVFQPGQAEEPRHRWGGWYSQSTAKSPVNPGLHWTWVESGRLVKSANLDVNGHPRSVTEMH